MDYTWCDLSMRVGYDCSLLLQCVALQSLSYIHENMLSKTFHSDIRTSISISEVILQSCAADPSKHITLVQGLDFEFFLHIADT